MHVSELLAAAIDYGWYVNPIEVAVLLVVVVLWGKLLLWMDADSETARLPGPMLNSVFIGGLIFGFILFLALPGFGVALTVFLVVMVGELVTYLVLRNQKVGLADLSKQVTARLKGSKKKGKKGAKPGAIDPNQLVLLSKKGVPFTPSDEDPSEEVGYNAVLGLLTDPIRRNADRVDMRPTEAAAPVKYTVDGAAYDGRALPREEASAAVLLLKRLGAMDLNDRRKPQTGAMKVAINGQKRDLQIQTAGSTAGESVRIEVDPKKRYDLTIDQLGFSEDQLTTVDNVIGEGQGIVLLAAPSGHGLTSLIYAVLRRHDAFLSHIQTIEREAQLDLEGIKQNALASAAGGEEAKLAKWVISQEPDVLMMDKVEEQATAVELVRYAATGRRAYVGMRTGSTFEALQAWRNLVGDDKLAMKQLRLVVAGRLVRRLCAACKMDFNPDPDTLRRLNMPPERVGKLFTARTTPLKDHKGRDIPCEFCLDLRFKGRTGVFELFMIDDEVKQVVQAGGSVNQLKMLFKKQRQRYMQEQALALAVAGETSLNEIARVLKAGETPPPASGRR